MFENLDKPVVLCNHHDIATSIEYVSRLSIPEVVVIRNKHILRGVRVSDPSFPPLGKVDKDIEIRMDEVLKANGKGMRYIPFTKKHYVIVIKLFPGINAKYLENILSKQNVNGIVFETFGQDSHPTDKMFLKELIKLSQKGILMVNIHGGDLSKFGVIKGSDMTVDAALAKLYYIITTCKPEIAKQVLLSPLRGELTPPVSNVSIS
jgi:L-asparaginase